MARNWKRRHGYSRPAEKRNADLQAANQMLQRQLDTASQWLGVPVEVLPPNLTPDELHQRGLVVVNALRDMMRGMDEA